MALQPINYSIGLGNPAESVLNAATAGQGLMAQAEQRGLAQDQNARAQAAEGRAADLFPIQMQRAELGIQEAQLGLQAQRQKIEAQRAQMQRAQAYRQGWSDLISKGSAATIDDFDALNAQFPEQAQATMEYFDSLDERRQRPLVSTLAQAATALKTGNVKAGMEVARNFADAARASGDVQLADMADGAVALAEASPDAAFAQIGTLLSQVDPDLAKTVLDGGALKKDVDLGPDIEGESKLRKEFTNLPVVKNFSEVRDAFSKIGAAAKNPDAVSDLALIFSYMKLLDPGSVVRETEFATAQNAAGVPDRIRSQFNKVLSGERLAPEQRKAFVGTAGALFNAQKDNYDAAVNDYRELASQYGYEPDRIVKASESEGDDTDAAIAEQAKRFGVSPEEAQFVFDLQQAAQRGERPTPEQQQRLQEIRQKMVAQ